MKIEIWTDFICPYSYLGKRSLERALVEFPDHKNVFIEYKSYELDPGAGQYTEEGMHELLAKAYQISIEEAELSIINLVKQAEEFELIYDLERIQRTNTFDAHRLTQYAKRYNKDDEMSERLFKACFTELKHIGEHHVLLELAKEVGLNVAEVETVLESRKFSRDVRFDQAQAIEIDVKHTPFFVFNEEYAVSGIQSTEVLLEVLHEIWREENKQNVRQNFQPKQTKATYCCEGEDCEQEEIATK